jgi:ribosomal protein L7/L12
MFDTTVIGEHMNITIQLDHNSIESRSEVAQAVRGLFDAKVIDIVQYLEHLTKLACGNGTKWYTIGAIEDHLGVKSVDSAKVHAMLIADTIDFYATVPEKDGPKIATIKFVRSKSAMGLKEAKDFVEEHCKCKH